MKKPSLALLWHTARGWNLELASTPSSGQRYESIPIEGDRVEEIDWVKAFADVKRSYSALQLVIAIPSELCLLAPVIDATAKLQGDFRGAPASYLIEQVVPLAAEAFHFGSIGSDTRTTAIVVRKSILDPVVCAAAETGMKVGSIVPAALLRAQASLAVRSIIFIGEAVADLVVIEDGRPIDWQSCAADQSSIDRELRMLGRSGDDFSLINAADTQDILSYLRKPISEGAVFWGEIDHPACSSRLTVGQRASASLFRAAAVALLLASVGFGLAALKANRETHAAATGLATVHHQVFPDRPVPLDVSLSLESERRRLRQTVEADGERRMSLPVAKQLAACLRTIPRDLRVRINTMQFGPSAFVLEGTARTLGDVERITSSIKQGKELTTEAPRTEQINADTVAFVITGRASEGK